MSKKKYNLNTIYISERLQENLKPISQSAFTAVPAPWDMEKQLLSTGIWTNRAKTEIPV